VLVVVELLLLLHPPWASPAVAVVVLVVVAAVLVVVAAVVEVVMESCQVVMESCHGWMSSFHDNFPCHGCRRPCG
jgi:hypothetical protein